MTNTTKLTDQSEMPFGKYKGKKLANVPDEVLYYYYNHEWFNKNTPLGVYIKENLDSIKKNAQKAIANRKYGDK